MLKKIVVIVLVASLAVVAGLFVLESKQADTDVGARVMKSENGNDGLDKFKEIVEKKKYEHEQGKDFESNTEFFDGVGYTKINVYELFDICERKDAKLVGNRFVMRGVVYNAGQQDTGSSFILMRHTLWCCEDHAVSFGFWVDSPKAESFENGQWVKVYGKLEKGGQDVTAIKTDSDDMKKINLAPNVDIEKNWVFAATRIENVKAPEQLHISYWNTKEPFYY
ncbi:hypothetical protein [Maridesulfovibrio sp.]|uniref:TIGR03943 family putative permease subunit n=1 Tax=Maridesulfovibrio sp. TaxID=2795000 RepID=UPI003BA91033